MKVKSLAATLVVLLIEALLVCTLGCGGATSGGNSTTSGGNSTTSSQSLAGNWTVSVTGPGTTSTIQATLVSSPCTVSTPIGTFSVTGSSCFIADSNTGQGSVSGSGDFLYPPQGVLIGITNSSAGVPQPVDFLFVEADSYGDAAVFGGQGEYLYGAVNGWYGGPFGPGCNDPSVSNVQSCQYSGPWSATPSK